MRTFEINFDFFMEPKCAQVLLVAGVILSLTSHLHKLTCQTSLTVWIQGILMSFIFRIVICNSCPKWTILWTLMFHWKNWGHILSKLNRHKAVRTFIYFKLHESLWVHSSLNFLLELATQLWKYIWVSLVGKWMKCTSNLTDKFVPGITWFTQIILSSC